MGNTASSPDGDRPADPEEMGILELLLHSLLVVQALTKALQARLQAVKDRRYKHLANFRGEATTVCGHLRAIKRTGLVPSKSLDSQMHELAQLLEEVFDEQKVEEEMERLALEQNISTATHSYPRLQAVAKIFPLTSDTVTISSATHLVTLPRKSNPWNLLQQQLAGLRNELQKYGDDEAPHEHSGPTRSPETRSLSQFADRVLSALACNDCGSIFAARLRLGTYHANLHTDAATELCLLLEGDAPLDRWREVHVHDIKIARPRVRFAGGEAWQQSQPTSFPCLCHALRTVQDPWRLNIVLDSPGSSVQRHDFVRRAFPLNSLSREVNLKTLIASSGKHWHDMAKLALAVIVSYSLFHFYGSHWAKDRWSRLNIVFFADAQQGHTPLRPFLSSDPEGRGAPLTDPRGSHRYPEILELGIILLEIHLGTSLENSGFLYPGTDTSVYDSRWLGARQVFQDRRLYIGSVVFRNAIDQCLKCDFSLLSTDDSPTMRDQIVRNRLFNEIVKPLEGELQRNFKDDLLHDSLDEDAARNINLANGFVFSDPQAAQNVQVVLPGVTPTLTTNIRHWSGTSPAIDAHDAETEHVNEQINLESMSIYGDEGQAESLDKPLVDKTFAEIAKLKGWISDELLKVSQPKLETVECDKVRIAVIDTGAKVDQAVRQSYSNRLVLDEDLDGHGTHLASLLLGMTDDIEAKVYMAQVFDYRNKAAEGVNDVVTEDSIAQAIRYAVNVWKVDIISMSFGCRLPSPKIGAEIESASGKGVLVFAAASNDGLHQAYSWPASHRDVLCVYAADANGRSYERNARATPDRDNFAFLGVCVKALGLPPSRDRAAQAVVRSGTSIATPFAVSLAATIIHIVRLSGLRYESTEKEKHQRECQRLPLDSTGGHELEFENCRHHSVAQKKIQKYERVQAALKTTDGIARVFKHMVSRKDEGHNIVYPGKLFDRAGLDITLIALLLDKVDPHEISRRI